MIIKFQNEKVRILCWYLCWVLCDIIIHVSHVGKHAGAFNWVNKWNSFQWTSDSMSESSVLPQNLIIIYVIVFTILFFVVEDTKPSFYRLTSNIFFFQISEVFSFFITINCSPNYKMFTFVFWRMPIQCTKSTKNWIQI